MSKVLTELPIRRYKPPIAGVLKRKPLLPGAEVWVLKSHLLDVFVPGVVLSSCEFGKTKLYQIRFDETKRIADKLYTGNHLAYRMKPDCIVPIGTRVAARFTNGEKVGVYAGIVAEYAKTINRGRYLVFFDKDDVQYVYFKDIYVMCHQSTDVADDVHEVMKNFDRSYLRKYPEFPLLTLRKNQVIKVESDCQWWDAKVLDIDASMALICFLAKPCVEWIYRGSPRLLYNNMPLKS